MRLRQPQSSRPWAELPGHMGQTSALGPFLALALPARWQSEATDGGGGAAEDTARSLLQCQLHHLYVALARRPL